MCRILVGFISLILAGYATAEAPGEDRWLDRKSEGWFWYKAEPEPVEPEEVKPPAKEPIITTTSTPQDTGPAPLSSAWIRENIQSYLDAAIDNPTPENVSAYLYIQRYAMDKSFTFMDSVQKATLGSPDLDEINRRPLANYAKNTIRRNTMENEKTILRQIAKQAGLFFFLDSSELSTIQTKVVNMIEETYGFYAINITDDPNIMNSPNTRANEGRSEQMGINSFPSIALITPDGTYDVIARAPVSLSELKTRILVGSLRLGLIDDSDYNMVRLVDSSSTQTPVINKRSSSNVPISPREIISIFNGGQDVY